MTNKEAISILQTIRKYPSTDYQLSEVYEMAIQALENIGHLKDRPCDVCEFRKENGCCKWDCVFD